MQRNVSRKGSPRSNNERKLHCDANGNDKETSFPQSPLRGKFYLNHYINNFNLYVIFFIYIISFNTFY